MIDRFQSLTDDDFNYWDKCCQMNIASTLPIDKRDMSMSAALMMSQATAGGIKALMKGAARPNDNTSDEI